jgi:protein SCO1
MTRQLRSLLVLTLVVLGLSWSASARAVPIGGDTPGQGIPAGMPRELEDVGVDEHMDGQLPLDADFRDHTGKPVKLGEFFDGKRPVVFLFAYHTCPVVCSLILSDTIKSLKEVEWTIGKEFDVVVISVNPHESLEKTAAKRAGMLGDYVRPEAANGLHLLVGDKVNIDRAAAAVGFKYKYDADIDQYAHPSVVMLAKPNGRVARYLYGLEFPPNDMRIGLLEASEGRSISTVEQVILYCYHYDPKGGKYVLVASRVMRLGGGLTAVILGSVLSMFWIRERRKGGLLSAAVKAPTSGELPAKDSTSDGEAASSDKTTATEGN